jgi:hypothetical protein
LPPPHPAVREEAENREGEYDGEGKSLKAKKLEMKIVQEYGKNWIGITRHTAQDLRHNYI